MNIYDISRKAGVSIATVSRVLNGSSHVSDKIRERVMDIIESENYSPNVFARGLSLDTMQSVGILYCDASDLYLANAVYYLERYFRHKGYVSLLCCCGYSIESRQKYINLMLSKKVDALILAGSHFVEDQPSDNDYILEAAKHRPVGLLSGNISDTNVLCAYCDDQTAAYELASEFFHRGAKKIAFLHSVNSASTRQKIAGLKMAYKDQGLRFSEENAIFCVGDDGQGDGITVEEVVKSRKYDGLLCMDDAVAVTALKCAQREGIQVPEELKIAGYNNSILSRCTTPELTTADNHTKELCKELVEMVTAKIEETETPMQYSVKGTVMLRGTT